MFIVFLLDVRRGFLTLRMEDLLLSTHSPVTKARNKSTCGLNIKLSYNS